LSPPRPSKHFPIPLWRNDSGPILLSVHRTATPLEEKTESPPHPSDMVGPSPRKPFPFSPPFHGLPFSSLPDEGVVKNVPFIGVFPGVVHTCVSLFPWLQAVKISLRRRLFPCTGADPPPTRRHPSLTFLSSASARSSRYVGAFPLFLFSFLSDRRVPPLNILRARRR